MRFAPSTGLFGNVNEGFVFISFTYCFRAAKKGII